MNPERGEYPITLQGEDYTLKYTFNALAMAEEMGMKPVPDLARSEFLLDLRVLLLCGLYHENKKLRLDQVGRLMDGSSLEYLRKSVIEAISLSLSFDEEEADEEEPGESEAPPHKGG